jgi:hypothetical protein
LRRTILALKHKKSSKKLPLILGLKVSSEGGL